MRGSERLLTFQENISITAIFMEESHCKFSTANASTCKFTAKGSINYSRATDGATQDANGAHILTVTRRPASNSLVSRICSSRSSLGSATAQRDLHDAHLSTPEAGAHPPQRRRWPLCCMENFLWAAPTRVLRTGCTETSTQRWSPQDVHGCAESTTMKKAFVPYSTANKRPSPAADIRTARRLCRLSLSMNAQPCWKGALMHRRQTAAWAYNMSTVR